MKKHLLLIIALMFGLNIYAQNWTEMMYDPNANFYDVQNLANEYWKDRDVTERGKGYKPYKRWEEFVERRVYPTGELSQLNLTVINYQKFLEDNGYATSLGNQSMAKFSNNNMTTSTTWTAIGPMGPISGTAGGQLLKSGRINFIAVSPTNSNVLFIGAPAGGLWKSTNGGASWTTNTDNFPVCGFSDLGFDATNTNIMYAASGDGDAGDTRSVGVYKSTDGGNTWNITGLTFNVSQNVRIRRLIVHPTNSQIVLIGGSNGIYRTTNGGTSWTQVSTTNTYDLEFKPGDPNTVYAGGTTFRRSTNGGVNWTTITGVPASGTSNRLAIAVTPHDPNYVYVLASNNSGSGFLGFLRSTNSGTSFTNMPTSLNLLGWASAGNDSGGQGWYDLCVACNPLNKDEVVVGGVNVWRTTNGGGSWSLYGHWTGSGAPFTHADHHDLEYASNGTLFNANDGTVYRRTATTWQEISGTINISQIYKIGLSSLTANLWITGHQDNGTSTWNGTTYQARMGGDGMDCFIDRTNNNNMFAEYYNGAFRKSTNGGVSWSACTSGMSGSAPWVTIWKQDPVVASRLYAGRQNMFVSNNQAGSWSQIGTLPVSGSIREFAIAPSNNQVLYVIKTNAIMKTTNGGTSWTNVTGSLSTSIGFENVVISPTDANKVWVVAGNYSAGNKVFYSSNGGTTWTNWSSNLPNIPGNCLLYEPGSNDRIYVGMDVGVYYRDASSSTWTLYNTGLPNCPISDMEISPAMASKLVAATYGRGTWMVDLAPSALPPVSSFAFTGTVCTGVSKTFNDNSTNSPTSWSWSVSPSTGVTISSPTSQNPNFTFTNPGNYVVSMQATNPNGPGNTYTTSVNVQASPNVVITSNLNSVCAGSPVTFTASGANTYNWNCPTASVCLYYPSATTTYTFMGTATNGCTGVGSKVITVIPNVTVNTVASSTSICSAQSVTITASGASAYTWTPGNMTGSSIVVSPTTTTTYFVTGSNGTCTNTANKMITVGTSPTVTAVPSETLICAGTAATITASGASTYSWNTGPTSNSIVVSPVLSTNYTVTGFNGQCSHTFTLTLNVAWCTAINENNSLESLKVFPNPFNELLSVVASEDVEVNIYNALGQIVITEKGLKENSINTKNLPSGVYLVEIKGASGKKAFRVIKE
ncbi:MAG: T9SS type A sorting domain-containing protein [Bacteroidia bacterium]